MTYDVAAENTDPTTSLVVVGVPTYNRAHQLKRALDSALGQKQTNVSIMISDNASEDTTRELCAEYAQQNSNILVFRQERNISAADNFLSLLNRSKSPYFMWLADDDWIDPNYLAVCVECLENDPDVVLAYGRAEYYRDRDFILRGLIGSFSHDSALRRILSYFGTVKDNGMFYGVYRREALDGVRFFDCFAGDWLFIAQILARGKARQISATVIHRQLGGASESTRVLAQKSEKNIFARKFPFFILGIRIIGLFVKEPVFKESIPLLFRLLAMPLLFSFIIARGLSDTVGHLLKFTAKHLPSTAAVIKQIVFSKDKNF